MPEGLTPGGQPIGEGARIPSESVTLNEDKSDFLSKKLAQYRARLAEHNRDISFTAPEQTDRFHSYYDTLAKVSAAETLLEGGAATRSAFEAKFRSAVREYWIKQYSDRSDSVENILDEHDLIIQMAARNAWGVICAYNEGRTENIIQSQPVDG